MFLPIVKTQFVSELAEICPSAERVLATMHVLQK